MIGIKQAAAFSEPRGIAVLPDGTSCVVADRTNRRVRIVTRGGVASTLAGSGGCGSEDGTLAAASFDDPAEVAVDVDGHVLVVDWARNHFRKVDPSTGQVTTLRDENGVAMVSSDGFGCGCCAIDNIGSIWFANDDGIDIISNTSFSAGYNAWTFMQWKPNSQRLHLCSPQGKDAVVVVLSSCARSNLGTVPHTGWLWARPHMPIEICGQPKLNLCH